MNRLRHNERALIRTFQMSRLGIFVFVEGWKDRYFYDRLCKIVCKQSPPIYQVRTSQELGAQNSGKASLIGFFSYLRRRKLLFHEFKGKKLAIVFFLDKDVDEILRLRKRSDHVVYTRYYCLENHLLKHVNLADLIAAAAGLDEASVLSAMGDQEAWMLNVASTWKDWIKLCLLGRVLNVNSRCGYGRASQVNENSFGKPMAPLITQMLGEIHTASGLPTSQFDAAWRRIDRTVENMFARSEHDRIFKGKWYIGFMPELAKRAAAGRQFDANGLEATQVFAIANKSVDPAERWAASLRAPLERIVALL
jgi:hypothetical protein